MARSYLNFFLIETERRRMHGLANYQRCRSANTVSEWRQNHTGTIRQVIHPENRATRIVVRAQFIL